MKKQYLIGLLGITALTIPVGSSLLEANSKLSSATEVETPELNTGITIDKDSKITVWDMDKNGSVSANDQIQGFTFNTTFDEANLTEGLAPQKSEDSNNGLNVYYGENKEVDVEGETNKEKFEVSFAELNTTNAANKDNGTFKLEANATENTKGKYEKIWGKELVNTDPFVVTMDTTYTEPEAPAIERPTKSTNQEVTIGKIDFSENVVNEGKDSGSVVAKDLEVNGNTASVSYNIGRVKDAKNEEDVEISEVEWVDGNDENASNFGDSKVISGDTTTGKLVAKNLDYEETYEGTNIKVTFADGETLFAPVDDITTDFEVKESTIEQEGTVNVISSNEASVDFVVTPGQDKDGAVEVVKVKWMDGRKELANSDEDLVNEGEVTDLTSGTLKTDKLQPETTYDETTLEVEMSDGITVTASVKEFTTDFEVKESTIEQEGTVNVISSNEASVDFVITPGQDKDGAVEVVKVKWMDGRKELANSDEDLVNEGEVTDLTSGTLKTDKLQPETTYDETTLEVEMSDGITVTASVKEFTTDFEVKESTIEQEGTVDVISPSEASVNFAVTLGQDKDGAVEVVKVTWMDGEQELANSDEDLVNEGEVTDLTSGTLKTDKLESNTPYNDTTLIAEMSDGTSTNEADVNDFNEKNVEPEVNEIHHVKVDYNNDILNVKGTIDTHGSVIEDIYFVKDENRIHTDYIDNEANQVANSNEVTYDMWTKEYTGEMDENGNPNLEGYSIVIDYGTEIFEESLSKATTDDHSALASEQAIEEELGYLIPTNKLGGWAIFGIIIATLSIVGIIGYGGYYLYKKHQA